MSKDLSERYNQLLNKEGSSIERDFIDFLIEKSEIECPEVDVIFAWNKFEAKVVRQKSSFHWLKIAAAIVIVCISTVLLIQIQSSGELLTVSSLDQKAHVKLPDGSIAVLNKNSTFSYPSAFGDERLVSFQGEAYFEVKKNPKPFIIDVGSVQVKVLGTLFNLETHGDEISLFVNRGLVAFVNNGVETQVRAGMEAVFNKKDRSITFSKNPSHNIMSWRNGVFKFNDTPLSVALNQLEEYYNVSFKLNNKKLESCKITASFEKKSLNEILKVFSSILQVKMKQKGDIVRISGNGC